MVSILQELVLKGCYSVFSTTNMHGKLGCACASVITLVLSILLGHSAVQYY